MNRTMLMIEAFSILMMFVISAGAEETIQTDLLIVGGTESGCAAAVQAARMGVKSITLVNDIDWLGGQFSAESLVAIDENRGPAGYGHGVPFPRSGIFGEVMRDIEALNVQKYGVPRPGNTRVITTCLPSDAERIFRELARPHLESGVLRIQSNYFPVEVLLAEAGNTEENNTVSGVRFQSTTSENQTITVRAQLTIDASEWGDVIRLSGAAYEFGPDLKARYNEPLAPTSRADYPLTDMNPITYCMVLKETDSDQTIAQPSGFDRRNFDKLPYPSDPSWIYESRRIVDRHHFPSVTTPDAVLLCFPAFDYPLDVYSQKVTDELEETEPGASKKNIVEMTRKQRQIVFNDAKQRSLGYLYYLQTILHEKASDPKLTFRKLKLADEFDTPDHLPPKPYVRESLRLKSMYQLRQQDTMGVGNDARNYASAMFHDAVACWQFEYDFHPTMRKFIDSDLAGPWHSIFRKNRTWGPPYSGRAQFSLRSLVPEKVDGLLGAQKNLGYSSIVSSAVRLHDQSIAVGQGCGAVAAVSLRHRTQPRTLPWNAKLLSEIWDGLLKTSSIPQTLWPFGDLEPTHKNFVAINQLAVRQLIPLAPNEVEFYAEQEATRDWQESVIERLRERKLDSVIHIPTEKQLTRGEFAEFIWDQVKASVDQSFKRMHLDDADGDNITDADDPVPFQPGRSTWSDWSPGPGADGLPDPMVLADKTIQRFNFCGKGQTAEGFSSDHGLPFNIDRGYGWTKSVEANSRVRSRFPEKFRDSFLFTRSHDTWELNLASGRYEVTVCVGDSGHEQFGQNLTIEGTPAMRNITTPSGQYHETTREVEVTDGRLTIEIGLPGASTNTCLNWLAVKALVN